MKTILALICLCGSVTAQIPNIQGRYQLFQQVDGLYAFDTQTGEVYFLKLVKGLNISGQPKLVWVKLSEPIAKAIEPH